jgi:hypothetical protein
MQGGAADHPGQLPDIQVLPVVGFLLIRGERLGGPRLGVDQQGILHLWLLLLGLSCRVHDERSVPGGTVVFFEIEGTASWLTGNEPAGVHPQASRGRAGVAPGRMRRSAFRGKVNQ